MLGGPAPLVAPAASAADASRVPVFYHDYRGCGSGHYYGARHPWIRIGAIHISSDAAVFARYLRWHHWNDHSAYATGLPLAPPTRAPPPGALFAVCRVGRRGCPAHRGRPTVEPQ